MVQKQFNRGKTTLLTNGAGTSIGKKVSLNLSLTPYIKLTQHGPETKMYNVKLWNFGAEIGENVWDLGLDKEFLDLTSKITIQNRKN